MEKKKTSYLQCCKQFYELIVSKLALKESIETLEIEKYALTLLKRSLSVGAFEDSMWLIQFIDREKCYPLIVQEILYREEGATHYPALSKIIPHLKWLLTYTKHHCHRYQIAKEELDTHALELGYGYKAANLMVLKGMVPLVAPLLKSTLSVPPFIPIAHQQIWLHLCQTYPTLPEEWNEFLNSFPNNKKELFLQAPDIQATLAVGLLPSEEGNVLLERIQDRIKKSFNSYHCPLLTQWLMSNPCDFVIVRSSGREDSDENANAGGNKSEPFVKPSPEAISYAIGEVIASYFSILSITQRLQAGDKSVFEGQLFLPVLVQKIIHETNAGGIDSRRVDIPVSGVLFTKEHGKADVTKITTAFGSNEGVVNNKVAVDTFVSGYPTIRIKPTRFVHIPNLQGEGFKVAGVKNPKELAYQTSISKTVDQDLDILGKTIGTAYGNGLVKPMDMEFTITLDRVEDLNSRVTLRPHIHALQARPLRAPFGSHQKWEGPAYIDLKKAKNFPSQDKEKGFLLMGGLSTVRMITDPQKQVIQADNLEMALREYQTRADAHEVDLVIVHEMATDTSHPGVTFKPTNIPIFIIENPKRQKKIERMIFSSTKQQPLLVCPQREFFLQVCNDNDINGLIKKGLVSYPGSTIFSTLYPPSFKSSFHFNQIPKETLVETEIHFARAETEIDFLETVESTGKKWIQTPNNQLSLPELFAQYKDLCNLSLPELFDIMALEESTAAKKALGIVFLRLTHFSKKIQAQAYKETGRDLDRSLADDFCTILFHAFVTAKNRLIPALENESPNSMNRLIHLKYFQAFIFQESDPTVLGSVSFKSLISLWQSISSEKNNVPISFSSLNIEQTPENQYYWTLIQQIHSEKTQKIWVQFIQLANKDSKTASLLREIITLIKEYDILSYWLNVVIANNNDLCKLHTEVTAAKPTFEIVLKNRTILDQIETEIPNWANPVYVEKNLSNFDLKSVQLSNPFQWNNIYNKTSPLGKFAVLNFFEKIVTIYDLLIKQVTGSPSQNRRQQALHFATLLQGYLKMLGSILKIAGPQQRKIMCYTKTTFDQYLANLYKGTSYNFGFVYSNTFTSKGLNQLLTDIKKMSVQEIEEFFQIRDIFNVQAIAIGSRADLDFSAHWPSTGEELFTTIHQSMEYVIRFLKLELGFNSSVLSSNDQLMLDLFTVGLDQGKKYKPDIQINQQTVYAHYNLPLRQHAAQIEIQIPKKPTTPISLKISVYGNEEHDRWKQIASFGSIVAALWDSHLTPPQINYQNPKGVSFTLQIPRLSKETASFNLDKWEQLPKILNHLLFDFSLNSHLPLGATPLLDLFINHNLFHCFGIRSYDDFLLLPSQAFENAPFIVPSILEYAYNKNQSQHLIRITAAGLKGIIHYKLEKTETPCIHPELLNAFVLSPWFKLGAVTYAELCFIAVWAVHQKTPLIFEEMQSLFGDPIIAQKFSNELNSFPLIIKADQFFEKYLLEQEEEKIKQFPRALSIAYICEDKQKIQKVSAILEKIVHSPAFIPHIEFLMNTILSLLPQHRLTALMCVADYSITSASASTKAFFLHLKSFFKKLSTTETESYLIAFDAFIEKSKDRISPAIEKYVKNQISSIRKNDFSQCNFAINFSKNLDKLLAVIKNDKVISNNMIENCAQILLVLIKKDNILEMNVPSLVCLTTENEIIGRYLGNPHYNYFPSNQYFDTTKIHKIVSFTLMHALENPLLQERAFYAISSLIKQEIDNQSSKNGKLVLYSLINGLINHLSLIEKYTPDDVTNLLIKLCEENISFYIGFKSYINSLEQNKIQTHYVGGRMTLIGKDENLGLPHQLFAGCFPLLLDPREFSTYQIKKAVVLLEKSVFKDLDLESFYQGKNIAIAHCPMGDFGVPYTFQEMDKILEEIKKGLQVGNVFIHCLGGKGRTGLVLACFLGKQLGIDGEAAIAKTRSYIPLAIETREQEQFVITYVNKIPSRVDSDRSTFFLEEKENTKA